MLYFEWIHLLAKTLPQEDEIEEEEEEEEEEEDYDEHVAKKPKRTFLIEEAGTVVGTK